MSGRDFNEFQLEKSVQKIFSYNNNESENQLYNSNEIFVLYEDGKVEHFSSINTNEILSSHAIDIEGSNDYTFILEYDNVKVYGEYINNTASQGVVIYANKTFSSSK